MAEFFKLFAGPEMFLGHLQLTERMKFYLEQNGSVCFTKRIEIIDFKSIGNLPESINYYVLHKIGCGKFRDGLNLVGCLPHELNEIDGIDFFPSFEYISANLKLPQIKRR